MVFLLQAELLLLTGSDGGRLYRNIIIESSSIFTVINDMMHTTFSYRFANLLNIMWLRSSNLNLSTMVWWCKCWRASCFFPGCGCVFWSVEVWRRHSATHRPGWWTTPEAFSVDPCGRDVCDFLQNKSEADPLGEALWTYGRVLRDSEIVVLVWRKF